jgi:ribonuclease G
MKQEIIANCTPEETRVAVIENGRLVELGIERLESEKIIGNIYKGRVENVLPGISSAFVNVGLEKNAYLYISDVIDQDLSTPEGGKEGEAGEGGESEPENGGGNGNGNGNPRQQHSRGGRQRHGGHHGHSHTKAIDQHLKRGDVFMVQVAKEAIGTKGVKISMDISLPGRFLVYLPFQSTIGVSKNIEEESERRRLKDLIEKSRPKKGGFIVRTEAEGIDDADVRREIRYLTRLWDNIQRRYHSSQAPALVHKDLGIVFQTVRDILSEDTMVFMVDNKDEYKDVSEFVQMISPEHEPRIKLFDGKTPIFEAFKVEKELESLLQTRVSLPSGGTIIIQEAESLCAIDVNTGKFTGRESQEETVTQTNIEAAEEVARQLRLRNIGGIVVIDFIDMRKARNRQKVVEALQRATANDRAKIKILPITRLGLVEMTRERKRSSILSTICQTCPECRGSGMVLSHESLMIRIQKEIWGLTAGRSQGRLRLTLHPSAAEYFQERKQHLSRAIGREFDLQSDGTLRIDDYKIVIE